LSKYTICDIDFPFWVFYNYDMEVNHLLRITVGNNLCFYRKKRGFSQLELSMACGVEQKTISRIENYLENTSINKLEQLCIGLKIHPYELFIKQGAITPRDCFEKICFQEGVIQLLYQYYLLLSTIKNQEISDVSYDTYGIGVKNYEELSIKDICTDKAFVESLINLCNLYQVDPMQLKDVVEDSFCQYNA